MPDHWTNIIEEHVAVWRLLDHGERERLEVTTDWLLRRKHWEAAQGFVLTDEITVTIAAQAALLVSRDAFVDLIKDAHIESLVDVRSYPGSRRVPHMARTALETWLPAADVDYRWEPRLGGRRRTSPGSVNVVLEHPSFRGYADYMTSQAFAEARAQLVADARERRTVIMCAESVWWRCHRRLIADSVMLLDRLSVTDLLHDGRLVPHTPMPVARLDGLHLVYDLRADAPLPI